MNYGKEKKREKLSIRILYKNMHIQINKNRKLNNNNNSKILISVNKINL